MQQKLQGFTNTVNADYFFSGLFYSAIPTVYKIIYFLVTLALIMQYYIIDDENK